MGLTYVPRSRTLLVKLKVYALGVCSMDIPEAVIYNGSLNMLSRTPILPLLE
jgi:hypothetical protein